MKRILVSIALFSLLATGPALAEQRYVIDELIITVRSGKTNQHNILKLLRSGAKVDVLEEVEEGEKLYARVRAGDIEGWVLAQYLSPEPIARDKLATINNKLESLKTDNNNLKQQLAVLRQKHSEVTKQRDAYDGNASSLGKELEKLKRAAAKPIETARQNTELRTELATLKKEHAIIQQDYERIKQTNERDWFIAGAGVVFFSTVFGILLTRIRLRRRKSWSDSI